MNWKFTILDRNNVATVIDEPVGWDANVSEIKRDPDWHGIFFSNQGETFEFDGLARELIKAEYDLYGSEGDMTLIMEEDCGLGYVEFSRGKFVFLEYDKSCGDSCYVKIPVETASEVMDLRNRVNQKVNLEATKAFDETTDLVPYDSLPFILGLPSKGIFIQDKAEAKHDSVVDFLGSTNFSGIVDENRYQLEFTLPDNQLSEIGNFSVNTDGNNTLDGEINNTGTKFRHPMGGVFPDPRIYPLNLNPVINYAKGSPNYGQISNPVLVDFLLPGKIDVDQCYIGSVILFLVRLPENNNNLANGEADVDYEYLAEYVISNPDVTSFPGARSTTGDTIPFNFVFNQNVSINKGDRFYLFMALEEEKDATQLDNVLNNGQFAYTLTLYAGARINVTNLSHTPASVAKVFAVNETISRIAESITNDRIRAYSDYFGRTDSQPYTANADGCGSMEVITDGIRIRRQENKIPGTTNVFSQSLEDIFNGLNPVHNIGMGIEPDVNRLGYNRLRVEPWKFFYNTTVVMSCTGIANIRRTVSKKDIYSIFKFGYNKWEAEEYNGLDEFLTRREGRTTLSKVKNDMVKLSTLIASGYAIEITRRKGNTDSKDWRYDKETFVICVTRAGKFHAVFDAAANTMTIDYAGDPTPLSVGSITIAGTVSNNGTRSITSVSFDSGGTVTFQFSSGTTVDEEVSSATFPGIVFTNLFVELGNVITPVNIIDPDTVYNYRISPVRNAMRWMNKVLESYQQFDTGAKLIFTDGDGNYFASGEMEDHNCKLENKAISENTTIDSSIYTDSNDAKPLMKPERVSYEYPMSSMEYKAIEANPYGLIYFENECDEGLGWIDTISYKPEEGEASFILIPAVDADPTGCVPVAIRGNGTLPAGTVGVPYSAVVNLYGTAPFNLANIIKPAWMTITVSGTSVFLSGTPTDVGTLTVSFDVDNCSAANTASFDSSVIIGAMDCDAVAIAGTPALPDGYVNTAYNYSFLLTGDGPFALASILKPSWMNIAIVGSYVVFSGTPLANASSVDVSFDINNCSGANSVSFSDTIDITTLCIPVSIPGASLPIGYVGIAYAYSIALGGTAPFTISNIVAPSWMTVAISGSSVVFSGTPDVAGLAIDVSFDVDNCTSDIASFAGTVDVINGSGGGGTDTNFANNDLTADADRLHDFAGFKAEIKNLSEFILSGENSVTLIPFVANANPSLPDQFFPNADGTHDFLYLDPSITNATITAILNVDGTDTAPVTFTRTDVGGGVFLFLAIKQIGTIITCVSYSLVAYSSVVVKLDAQTITYDSTKEILLLDGNIVKKQLLPAPTASVTDIIAGQNVAVDSTNTSQPIISSIASWQDVMIKGNFTDRKPYAPSLNIYNIQEFANNTDAIAGLLEDGDVYRLPVVSDVYQLAIVSYPMLGLIIESMDPSVPFGFSIGYTGTSFDMLIDWGDGSSPESFTGWPPGYNPSHYYSINGIYSVKVFFTDTSGSGVSPGTILFTQNYSVLLIKNTKLLIGGYIGLILSSQKLFFFNQELQDLFPSMQQLSLFDNQLTYFTSPLPPSLTELNVSINKLTSFTPTGPMPIGLTLLELYYNRFDSAGINAILAYLVTQTFDPGAKTLSLSQYVTVATGLGYTWPAAPPTGQGLIDKATLEADGWTVYVDP